MEMMLVLLLDVRGKVDKCNSSRLNHSTGY